MTTSSHDACVCDAGTGCSALDEVIFACADQAGEENRNVARMAALAAGLPVDVPAISLNRLSTILVGVGLDTALLLERA